MVWGIPAPKLPGLTGAARGGTDGAEGAGEQVAEAPRPLGRAGLVDLSHHRRSGGGAVANTKTIRKRRSRLLTTK